MRDFGEFQGRSVYRQKPCGYSRFLLCKKCVLPSLQAKTMTKLLKWLTHGRSATAIKKPDNQKRLREAPMDGSQSATAQVPAPSTHPVGETQAFPKDEAPAVRRRSQPESLVRVGPAASTALAAFNRVLNSRKSEALLLWPQAIEGIAVFHALAALARISTCDCEGLAALFFPWNRN